MGFDRWGVDEHCSNQKILNYKNKEEIFLLFNDVGPRLDRSNWPNIYHVDDYIDCHSVRPVKDYTKELQNLINKLK
jgi:hypothetical protein